MTSNREEWASARDSLRSILKELGFPEELGDHLAGILGSPKAILRMASYLGYERPTDIGIVVDEALSIREEIDAWRERKESEEANRIFNEYRRGGE